MKEYMSDEDFNKFLDEIENEQIKAPFYLKKEIMDSIEKNNKQQIIKFTRKSKKQYYMYTFKVCASVAVAIVLLFLMPNEAKVDKFIKTKSYNVAIEKNMKKASCNITEVFDSFSKKSGSGFINNN